jgi:uncharacterized protein
MQKEERINIRINAEIKRKVENVAEASGLSLSAIINGYLVSIARNGRIPLSLLTETRRTQSNEKSLVTFEKIYDTVNQLALKYGEDKIKAVYLFGSYARKEATKKSDIDFLIEPGEKLGIFDLARLNADLEEALGKKIDTISSLKGMEPHVVNSIIKDRKLLYATR